MWRVRFCLALSAVVLLTAFATAQSGGGDVLPKPLQAFRGTINLRAKVLFDKTCKLPEVEKVQ